MGATCNEGGIAEAGAATAAEKSSADLRLLQSLDAKIKELTEAGVIPISSAAGQTPTTIRKARQSVRAAASPTIDSTQTVRPLTSLELEASEASRWFAIELMLSANEIDAAQVPNLGIFEEYRLYSVAAPERGRLVHALRLGFYSSEIAAAAVLHYLTRYFPSATLKRVSIAECERFADKLITAGKDMGASGKRVAIELVSFPPGARGAHRYSTSQGPKAT